MGNCRKSTKRVKSKDLSRGIISTLFRSLYRIPKESMHTWSRRYRRSLRLDHDQTLWRWGYGTLDPVVKVHKGTVRRGNSSTSWEDEDVKVAQLIPMHRTYWERPLYMPRRWTEFNSKGACHLKYISTRLNEIVIESRLQLEIKVLTTRQLLIKSSFFLVTSSYLLVKPP